MFPKHKGGHRVEVRRRWKTKNKKGCGSQDRGGGEVEGKWKRWRQWRWMRRRGGGQTEVRGWGRGRGGWITYPKHEGSHLHARVTKTLKTAIALTTPAPPPLHLAVREGGGGEGEEGEEVGEEEGRGGGANRSIRKR